MKLSIHMKDPASRRTPVRTVELEVEGTPRTVEALLRAVATACAEDFNTRAEEDGLLSYLTQRELEGQARSGKVSFGVLHGDGRADSQRAADTAVECFEDGFFRIFLDEQPLEGLNTSVDPTSGALTFVRLTMLAGRIW